MISGAPLNEEDYNAQVWKSYFDSLGNDLAGDYYSITDATLSAGISTGSSVVNCKVRGNAVLININLINTTTSGTQTITLDLPFNHTKTLLNSNYGTVVIDNGVINIDVTLSNNDLLISGFILEDD